MTVSVLASGQIGSDGTGSISGSHDPGGGATPHLVVVFIVHNGIDESQVDTLTYGGVEMNSAGFMEGSDGSGETGCVAAYYLAGDSIPSGSQTVSLTVAGASTKRVYCASFSSDAGGLNLYGAFEDSDDQANPEDTQAIGSDFWVSGVACLFYGGASGSLSVATGAQLAEADFSGGSQCASLAWANATVNNGNVTIGWTAASDDVAATYVYFYETALISGNVTLSEIPVENATIIYTTDGVFSSNTSTDAAGDYFFFVDKGTSPFVYCYWEDGGNKYTAPLHWGISTV